MKEGTLIIGAGVVGLGIGWKLAQCGERVTILERGQAGHEASWAAAGMLAPANEAHFQQAANLVLARESMRLYPDFVAELEACSGTKVDYRTEGTLALALNADDAAQLKHHYEFQLEHELPVRWLSGDEAREMEPQLSNYVCAAVFSPVDHQIDNRLLVEALKVAYLKAGGVLHEYTEVTEFLCGPGGFQGARAGGRTWETARALLAAGSWSGMIAGIPEAARPHPGNLYRPQKQRADRFRGHCRGDGIRPGNDRRRPLFAPERGVGGRTGHVRPAHPGDLERVPPRQPG